MIVMAWHPGTYSCGHTGRVQITGPVKDRQWRASRIFSELCPECKQEKLHADRQEAARSAAERAEEMELPQLVGSEKQVSWALQIRQKFIEDSKEHIERAAENFRRVSSLPEQELEQEIEKSQAEYKKLIEQILANSTSASWWIDRRHSAPNEFIMEILQGGDKSEN